jgi:hypothetical protein
LGLSRCKGLLLSRSFALFVSAVACIGAGACSDDSEDAAARGSGSGNAAASGAGASSGQGAAGTGGSDPGVGGGGGVAAAGPCTEGAIAGACDCGGDARATGYCCSDQWFDPYYQELIGGCPGADAFRYVDPAHAAANDGGPGTIDAPWATIEHGVATTAAGQVLIVRAGTYQVATTGLRYQPALNPQSGAPGAPVILKADGEVLIEPAAVVQGTAQGGSAETIVLDDAASSQNDAYADHHVRIVGGTGAGQARQIGRDFEDPSTLSYDGGTRTVWVSLYPATGMGNWQTPPDSTSQYELVRNGPVIGTLERQHVIWDGFHARERDSYHPDTGPIVVWASQNVVLLNNDLEGQLELLYDNHNVVRIEGSNDVVIRNNLIHGLGDTVDSGPNNPQNHAAIMIYGSHDAIIEHNDIFDSYTGVFPKGSDGSGHVIRYNVVRDCTKAFRFSYHADLLVHQNVVHGCDQGFQLAENISGVIIANNVVHGGTSGVHNWFPIAGASAYSNVFLDVAYPNHFEGGVGTLSSDRNVFASFAGFVPGDSLAGWQSMGFDANSVEADPQFVDAAGHDYHLASGSTALTAGMDTADIDGDGDTTETIPAGAYVTGDEIIGPLPEP